MHTSYKTSRKPKTDYTYIKGEESHLVRRRMILKAHPEIATLLVDDQTYTYIVALACISLNLLNCYLSRVNIYRFRTCLCGLSFWTPTSSLLPSTTLYISVCMISPITIPCLIRSCRSSATSLLEFPAQWALAVSMQSITCSSATGRKIQTSLFR